MIPWNLFIKKLVELYGVMALTASIIGVEPALALPHMGPYSVANGITLHIAI
jgi:hypothetical protein